MKKLVSIAVMLVLFFTMGSSVLAYEDSSPVRINKNVSIMNEGTVNPAEEFDFTVGGGSGIRDGVAIVAPAFMPDTFTITVAQGEMTGFSDIVLPEFTQVGIYTYPITEVAGNTAGMRYDAGTYYLVVTVINNPEGEGFLRVLTLTEGNDVKTDALENEFYAGDLTINKLITGNFSDPDDEFEVTVTVTPNEGKVINVDPIVWNTTNVTANQDGSYTLVYTLKGDESVTIENLPYDVSYAVVETDPGEYDVTYDGNETGMVDAANEATTITNNRDTMIETGVNLNSVPYIVLLAIAGAGLMFFTRKRRVHTDD